MMRTWCLAFALVVAGSSIARADDPDTDHLYECKERPANSKISVTFAPQTSLKDLVTWVMGFTCKNIVFDSDVESRVPRVTILAPKPMTPKAALQLFIDAVEATGLKVVVKKDTMIIKLGPGMPKSCPSVTTTASADPIHTAPLPSTDTTAQDDKAAEELQKLIDSGIKKTDDTHYTITASVIDAILANPMAVAKGARVVPAVKDGKPDGFKLYAIRPSSVYAKLGFTNGDTIQKINGFSLDSADKALEVYTKLREAKTIQVDITRRGKALTLYFTIK